ncbi:ArgP/LysG family DNA-binding transcriptional regulator [Galactobacter caseinivorans]|nr:ArgP/LysG family DNA-binding transcriptional regulator [Galactobacter caseinivorans]
MSAPLPLHQLETLVAVVDEGGFEAAARRLHISAPAVSQRIRALELAVGRTLLQRTVPPVPTDPGERLLPVARRLVLLSAEAQAAVGLDGAGGDGAGGDGVGGSGPDGTGPGAGRITLPLAVNSDSLDTWFLDAIASAPDARRTAVHLERADQDHTAALLLSGRVVGAVSTAAQPVHGCTSTALGVVRYLPLCTPEFAVAYGLGSAHGPGGPRAGGSRAGGPHTASPHTAGLATAPRVDYEAGDDLQAGFMRQLLGYSSEPPRHRIPGSIAYVRAVEAGLGWGLIPEEQAAPGLRSGHLIPVVPGRFLDVPLFWQRLELPSATLERFSAHVVAYAAQRLRPVDS